MSSCGRRLCGAGAIILSCVSDSLNVTGSTYFASAVPQKAPAMSRKAPFMLG